MASMTPMMRQYLQLKEKYSDCLLFFRLGDFYEMFFDDAKTASRELELTLTGRDCGLEERAPMCGVPYHSVNTNSLRILLFRRDLLNVTLFELSLRERLLKLRCSTTRKITILPPCT